MEKKKLGAAGVVSIVFAVLNAIGVLVSTGFSLHIRHKFMAVYDDLGAELPGVTQMILNIHWALWILASLILLALLAVKELIPKKWIPLLLNGILVLMGIVYWAIFSIALMIPMMNLVQQMATG